LPYYSCDDVGYCRVNRGYGRPLRFTAPPGYRNEGERIVCYCCDDGSSNCPPPPPPSSFVPALFSDGTGTANLIFNCNNQGINFTFQDVYGAKIQSEKDIVNLDNQQFFTTISAYNSDNVLVSDNFVSGDLGLSYTFGQEKNKQIFSSPQYNPNGEREYGLLFSFYNNSPFGFAKNSVFANAWHPPARISSVTVQDYFTTQITGIINSPITEWTYSGFNRTYFSGLYRATDISGASGVSGYLEINNGDFSGEYFNLTGDDYSGFQSLFSGVNGITGINRFEITGRDQPLPTGFTSGLSVANTWQYFSTGATGVSGFSITGYLDSGNYYSVFTGGGNFGLVNTGNYIINFASDPASVNFLNIPSGQQIGLPSGDIYINIVEQTGLTGTLTTNYVAFINDIEQPTGYPTLTFQSTGLNQIIFNPAPPDNSTVLIKELSGVFSILNEPLINEAIFTINFDNDFGSYYKTNGVDLYTGSFSGEDPESLSGFSLLKRVTFSEEKASQNVTVYSYEVQPNTGIIYKFVPVDCFDTGLIYYNSGLSAFIFRPNETFFYEKGIPPTLSFEQRTGNIFSGRNPELTPIAVPGRDGNLIFQTGSSGENLYLLKSGLWKTILPYEELSGIFDLRYVENNQTGQFVSTGSTGSFVKLVATPQVATASGKIGEIAFSGTYLYAATGTNQWGRVQLSSW
jgi:hypothetical protein